MIQINGIYFNKAILVHVIYIHCAYREALLSFLSPKCVCKDAYIVQCRFQVKQNACAYSHVYIYKDVNTCVHKLHGPLPQDLRLLTGLSNVESLPMTRVSTF